MQAFHVRAGGRLFRITTQETFAVGGGEGPNGPIPLEHYVPVDCRDVRSTFESQAIVEAETALSRETLLADGQVRDAIASAYSSATKASLPDGFAIEIVP